MQVENLESKHGKFLILWSSWSHALRLWPPSRHDMRAWTWLLLLTPTASDYIADHSGCEPWCTAVNCAQHIDCTSCSFCKGPQRLPPVEASASTSTTPPKPVKQLGKSLVEAGKTANITHFWDCCKPSCGWDDGQGQGRLPLKAMCDQNGRKVGGLGIEAESACDAKKGRGVTTCPDMAPFLDLESGHWMGFVATQDLGTKAECCECYKLKTEFANTTAKEFTMWVQIISHGHVNGIFDLLVPGGGLGEFDGCSTIFPHSSRVPQSRFGGLHSPFDCDAAFAEHAGAVTACHWLFAGRMFAYPSTGVPFPGDALAFKASNEPCPEALNRRSGCAATSSEEADAHAATSTLVGWRRQAAARVESKSRVKKAN